MYDAGQGTYFFVPLYLSLLICKMGLVTLLIQRVV